MIDNVIVANLVFENFEALANNFIVIIEEQEA